MKKTILLSLILCFMLAVTCLADGSNIVISDAEIHAGDDFSLSVKLENNSEGISALRCVTDFDLDNFTLKSIMLGKDFEDFKDRLCGTLLNEQAVFFMNNLVSSTDDGELFILNLKARNDLPNGNYKIGLDIDQNNTLVEYSVFKNITVMEGNILVTSPTSINPQPNQNTRHTGGGGGSITKNSTGIFVVSGQQKQNEEAFLDYQDNEIIPTDSEEEQQEQNYEIIIEPKVEIITKTHKLSKNKITISAVLNHFNGQKIGALFDKEHLKFVKNQVKDDILTSEFEFVKGTPAGNYEIEIYADSNLFAKFTFEYGGYRQSFFDRIIEWLNKIFN